MTATTFKLVRFNKRRLLRGAEAAEVDVFEDGVHTQRLWMSQTDIKRNVKLHGHLAGLAEVQEAYRLGVDVEEKPQAPA